ncbi:MAG: pyruvate formate-lyase-activating protein [Oscillospiraceae bacterium]|nr:pyruvate formate-lyase-activating protein [Oscillospiraceae bacterium]
MKSFDTNNAEKNGIIHSIETCGTVDGPGLRYVAFFQGCPLRCKYCHNPDTWDFKGGTPMSVSELAEDVLKYSSYINFSGGGFTASGGEPLLQAEFISRLFKTLKSKGIHTAIDTSGARFPGEKDVESLLQSTDLVLLDIKSITPKKYREVTGLDIRATLAFAEDLSAKGIPAWIRYVIVPELTDSEEEAKSLCKYLCGLNNIKKVELLPFHKMGEHKWEALNRAYTLKETPPPSPDTMEKLHGIFAQYRLPV